MNWKFWQKNNAASSAPRPRYIGGKGARGVNLLLPSDTDFRSLFGRNRNTVWSSWLGNRILPLYLLRATSISDPLVRSIVQLTQNGVIGDMEIKPDFSCIKNMRKRTALSALWKEFCRAPEVGGKTTMLALQRSMVGQYFVDGRILATVKYHEHYPQGIAIKTLNRELLESSLVFGSNDPHNLGEIRDKDSGRITHYRVIKNPPKDGVLRSLSPLVGTGGGGETIDIPADRVFDWLGDGRADRFDASVSPLLAALRGLRIVEELDDASLKSLKASAQKMGFYKKSVDASDTVMGSGNTQEELAELAPEQLEFGSISELPHGWEFQSFDPAHPSTNTVEVRKAMLQVLCMSSGTEYLSAVGDAASANFSSLKHFSIKNVKQYRRMAKAMVNSIFVPFLKLWAMQMNLLGKVSLTESDMRQLCDCNWIYPTQASVEPLKDLQYGEGAVRMFTQGPDSFAAQNGGNIRDNIKAMSRIWTECGGEDMGSDINNAMAMQTAMGLSKNPPAAPPPAAADDGDDMAQDDGEK